MFAKSLFYRVFLISLLVFNLTPVIALSQQAAVKLSGRITDNKGRGLEGAAIGVLNTIIGTHSDAKGFYTLTLAPGRYDIAVMYGGYKTDMIKVVLKSGHNQTKNFSLKLMEHDLDAIHVYGKGASSRIKEAGFSMNVLEVKPLVNSAIDLSRIVDRSTGVNIRRSGGVGSEMDLTINGLGGNAVRYFLDGIPISSMGSGVTLQNLPVNIVERIEIHKGVVPAELLTDALGGAVNIITKKDNRNYLDATYGIASFGSHQINFNGQYVVPKTSFFIRPTIAYQYSKNDYIMRGVRLWNAQKEIFENKDIRRFHDRYSSLVGQLDFGVRSLRWADVFMISLSGNRIDDELQTGRTQAFVYGKAETKDKGSQVALNYQKRNFLVDNLFAEIYASFTRDNSTLIDTAYRKYAWDGTFTETHKSEVGGRGKSIRQTERPKSIVRLKLSYPFMPGHVLNLNYRFSGLSNKRSDDVDEGFVPSNDRLDRHVSSLSYTQLLFDGKWSNNFFAKSYYSKMWVEQKDLPWITKSDDWAGEGSTHNFGYGFATRYAVNSGIAVKLSYEHALRLPSARELLGNASTVYPNFALKPESSHNLNMGAYGNIVFDNVHRLSYEGTFFMRDVKDYIRLVISETEGLAQYGNESSVRVFGGEGEVAYSYKNRADASFNISYIDERSRDKYYPDGSLRITYNNRMPNRPWLVMNGNAGVRFHDLIFPRSELRLNYDLHYVHWFYLTWAGYGALKEKEKIPTQWMHSAGVTYSLCDGRYNVSIGVDNLFDSILYDNYKLQKPGRSLSCKLRLFLY